MLYYNFTLEKVTTFTSTMCLCKLEDDRLVTSNMIPLLPNYKWGSELENHIHSSCHNAKKLFVSIKCTVVH